MKGRFLFHLVFTLGLISPVFSQPAFLETLTLDASLQRAYLNNPQLLSAQKEVAIARAQVRQAKSLFFPRVNLNLNYVRYRNETLGMTSSDLGGIVLEAPLPETTQLRSNPFADNLYLGRLDFKQPLFTGGKLTYTYQLAKTNLKAAESEYESMRRQIDYQTRESFYRLLSLKEQDLFIDNIQSEIQAQTKQIRDPYVKGYANDQLSGLREQKALFRAERNKIRMEFQTLLGMELFSSVDVDGQWDDTHVPVDLQTALAWAKQNRLDLKQTALQAEVDQLSVDLSLSERFPVFQLGGAYEMRNTEFPLNDVNWNAVLNMNIPIFDGFSSLARIKETRARVEKSRLTRVQLEDSIDREIRTAYADIEFWESEYSARRDYVESIKDEKKSLSKERIDGLIWKLKAELKRIDARLQFILAKERLEKAMGKTRGAFSQ